MDSNDLMLFNDEVLPRGDIEDDLQPRISEVDTDDDDDNTLPHVPSGVVKRRAQNAMFQSWFSKRAETITKEEERAEIKVVEDERLSTRSLVLQKESNVIISDPREYQVELFEKAKQQNIIAVLDTGSGKTLIAVLLLKHIIDQEHENRARGLPRRVSFFLVNCVTLVFQQFSVLECNLDQKIERFCGEMGCDLWSQEIWEKHLSENMVIVCTAEVLHQCLMHSFIKMDQINLLIFDEAHHAKKNHPYARIIKDFYVDALAHGRPKIFGMTASPVDAKVDVVKAAKELETLLHCQVATTSDLSLLRKAVSHPEEVIIAYNPAAIDMETQLYRLMKAQFGDLEILSKFFRHSKEASSELGAWCADQVWHSTLANEEEVRKLERKMERDFVAIEPPLPAAILDAQISRLRMAGKIVEAHDFGSVAANNDSLSSKAQSLSHYLNSIFEKTPETKCIVFVQKRYTARLLGELVSRIGSAQIRLGILIGTRSGDVGDLNVSFRQQIMTLMRFRKGELNCLVCSPLFSGIRDVANSDKFATSIAEEGLDIPDCNLVIR
ncbi:MAG: hypothetical protein M1819_005952 [Sarea resinae]|nr:MAG: hypothetical protein M1819_005952 [Sarea resinae]